VTTPVDARSRPASAARIQEKRKERVKYVQRQLQPPSYLDDSEPTRVEGAMAAVHQRSMFHYCAGEWVTDLPDQVSLRRLPAAPCCRGGALVRRPARDV
jgi:hypothetical protein